MIGSIIGGAFFGALFFFLFKGVCEGEDLIADPKSFFKDPGEAVVNSIFLVLVCIIGGFIGYAKFKITS